MLKTWLYFNEYEVLMIYEIDCVTIPVVILKSDFDRAFGNIISLDYKTLISEYPYRYFNTGYFNLK